VATKRPLGCVRALVGGEQIEQRRCLLAPQLRI
jgi:hypothetical protein